METEFHQFHSNFAACHYPEQINPVLSTTHNTPNLFLADPILCFAPISAYVFQVVTSLDVYPLKPSPLRATCPTHLIIPDLVCRILFGEEQRL